MKSKLYNFTQFKKENSSQLSKGVKLQNKSTLDNLELKNDFWEDCLDSKQADNL
jgi:hypothetical protein